MRIDISCKVSFSFPCVYRSLQLLYYHCEHRVGRYQHCVLKPFSLSLQQDSWIYLFLCIYFYFRIKRFQLRFGKQTTDEKEYKSKTHWFFIHHKIKCRHFSTSIFILYFSLLRACPAHAGERLWEGVFFNITNPPLGSGWKIAGMTPLLRKSGFYPDNCSYFSPSNLAIFGSMASAQTR